MQWMDSFRGGRQIYPGYGYVVAFFNPHGSTGYGSKYTEAISKDWGGKVYEDVMKVTEALEKLPYVDSERMGAMGWFYDGCMLKWVKGQTKSLNVLLR
jgi:dipeptidyl aminopeptidase/acylaminoacyl peptidase